MRAVSFDVTVPSFLIGKALGRLTESAIFGSLSGVRFGDVSEPRLPAGARECAENKLRVSFSMGGQNAMSSIGERRISEPRLPSGARECLENKFRVSFSMGGQNARIPIGQ